MNQVQGRFQFCTTEVLSFRSLFFFFFFKKHWPIIMMYFTAKFHGLVSENCYQSDPKQTGHIKKYSISLIHKEFTSSAETIT